uniref:Uncharacterized protein n=1 Tax=Malurus cyaneus samueli TaxID=2593467 RepID=A0A8C5U372_9PASS
MLPFPMGLLANAFTLPMLVAKARRWPATGLTTADLLARLTVASLLLLLVLTFKLAEAAAGMVWSLPAVLCPMVFCFYSSMALSGLFLVALSIWSVPLAPNVAIRLLASGHCSVVFVAHYHSGGLDDPVDHEVYPVNPVAPTDHTDIIDCKTSPTDPTDLKINPIDPIDNKTNPIGPVDPKILNLIDVKITNPKIPTTPEPSDPVDCKIKPIHPRTNPANPKTSSPKTPKTPDPADPTVPMTSPALPCCYHAFSVAQLCFVLPLRLKFFFVPFFVSFSVAALGYAGLVRALLARPVLPRGHGPGCGLRGHLRPLLHPLHCVTRGGFTHGRSPRGASMPGCWGRGRGEWWGGERGLLGRGLRH